MGNGLTETGSSTAKVMLWLVEWIVLFHDSHHMIPDHVLEHFDELRYQAIWMIVLGKKHDFTPVDHGIILAVLQKGGTSWTSWRDFHQILPSRAHRLETHLFSRLAGNPSEALSNCSFVASLGSPSGRRMSVSECKGRSFHTWGNEHWVVFFSWFLAVFLGAERVYEKTNGDIDLGELLGVWSEELWVKLDILIGLLLLLSELL